MQKRADPIFKTDFFRSRSHFTFLNYFFLSLILYSTIYTIKGNYFLTQKIGDYLQLGATISLLIFSAFLLKFKIKNKYLEFFFIAYIIWAMIVILRGNSFGLKNIIGTMLDGNLGILLYFAPLILLIPHSIIFYKRLFDLIIVLGFIFFACCVLFRNDLFDRSFQTQDSIEYLARTFSIPCGFILLTYKYHSKKRNIIALSVMIISLLFSIYKARRGLSLTLGSVLFFAYFLYIFNTSQKLLIGYLSVFLLIIGMLYTSSIYNISNNKLLSLINERATDDSRSGAELFFYEDMGNKDWIIGRGMNGEYYCPIFTEEVNSDYRDLMETGYLQIILKGGLIRLILFLFIAIPAIFLGLFFSTNILAKASAFWIIIALISLYPSTVESFTLQYLLLWISISICYSRQIRMMPDRLIHENLKYVKTSISSFRVSIQENKSI